MLRLLLVVGAELCVRGSNSLLLFVLPAFISVRNFGFFSLLLSIEQVALSVLLAGQTDVAMRYGARTRRYAGELEIAGRRIVGVASLVALPFWIWWCFAAYDGSKAVALCLIGGAASFSAMREVRQSVQRAQKQDFQYARLRILHQAARIALVLTFALLGQQDGFYALGSCAASALFAVVLLWTRPSGSRCSAVRRFTSLGVRYGWPFALHAVLGVLWSCLDKVFIAAFLDETSLGVYSLASGAANIVGFPLAMLTMMYSPDLFQRDEVAMRRALSRYVGLSLAATVVAFAVMYVVYATALKSYPSAYATGMGAFLVIAGTQLVHPLYMGWRFVVARTARVRFLPLVTGASLAVSALVNVLLLRTHGIIAAAWALLAAECVLVVGVGLTAAVRR